MTGSRGRAADPPPRGCALICCAVGSGAADDHRDPDCFHRPAMFPGPRWGRHLRPAGTVQPVFCLAVFFKKSFNLVKSKKAFLFLFGDRSSTSEKGQLISTAEERGAKRRE